MNQAITFDLFVEKLAECEKVFGRKIDNPNENVCLAYQENPINQIASRGDHNDRGKGQSQWKKIDNQNDRQFLYCKRCGRKGSNEAHECKLSWQKIESFKGNSFKKKDKTKVCNDKSSDDNISGAAQFSCDSDGDQYVLIVLECASTSSWYDTWILDTGATQHMTFRRDYVEELLIRVIVVRFT